jgi:hypothetical protein
MAKELPDKLKLSSDKINRGKELSRNSDNVKNIAVGLMDIDSAVFYYFENVIKPIIEEHGEQVKVPIIYANPERWTAIQKQGALRDHKQKVMAPVVAFRRTGFSKDESLSVDKLDPQNPKIHYTYQSQYSKENRYDRFSALKGIVPKKEMYSVAVPDYVTLSYDFIVWTNFTDQMNSIVEKINWSEGSYWGEPGKFKFRTAIDSFEDTSEYEGNTRTIKTSFSMTLNGYLVPDSFNDVVTTQKFITPKQIIVTDETDINILPITEIDQGAKSIRVISNITSDGSGNSSTLLVASGSNIIFTGDTLNYNGKDDITTTIGVSLTPTFTSVSASSGTYGSLVVQGDLTAQRYIVSSSISIITQSFSSGSTIFGDTNDDTHQFTGSLHAHSSTGSFGRIEAQTISASRLDVDASTLSVGGTEVNQVLVNNVKDVFSSENSNSGLTVSGSMVISGSIEFYNLGTLGDRDLTGIIDLGEGFTQ